MSCNAEPAETVEQYLYSPGHKKHIWLFMNMEKTIKEFVGSETEYDNAIEGRWYSVLWNINDVQCWNEKARCTSNLLAGQAVECLVDAEGKKIFRVNSPDGDLIFKGKHLAASRVRLHIRPKVTGPKSGK